MSERESSTSSPNGWRPWYALVQWSAALVLLLLLLVGFFMGRFPSPMGQLGFCAFGVFTGAAFARMSHPINSPLTRLAGWRWDLWRRRKSFTKCWCGRSRGGCIPQCWAGGFGGAQWWWPWGWVGCRSCGGLARVGNGIQAALHWALPPDWGCCWWGWRFGITQRPPCPRGGDGWWEAWRWARSSVHW